MTVPTLLVGIDAGGSRTRALLAGADGNLLAQAEGGGGNLQEWGAEDLAGRFQELVRRLGPPVPPAALCAGVAGAGRAPEQAALRAALDRRQVARRCRVVSDARIALEGAHGGDPGIICIAGTGSMVLGRSADGRERRAGGWGPTLGDEGSAYALVVAGVRAVLRARDGWGPATTLAEMLLGPLGLSAWNDVVEGVYGGHLTRQRLAAACPVVFTAAREGDAVAQRLVRTGGTALGAQVAAVARHLALSPPVPVAVGGGVFQEIGALWPHLEAGADAVRLDRRPHRFSPGHGALLLAADVLGHRFPETALAAWERAAAP